MATWPVICGPGHAGSTLEEMSSSCFWHLVFNIHGEQLILSESSLLSPWLGEGCFQKPLPSDEALRSKLAALNVAGFLAEYWLLGYDPPWRDFGVDLFFWLTMFQSCCLILQPKARRGWARSANHLALLTKPLTPPFRTHGFAYANSCYDRIPIKTFGYKPRVKQ